MNGPPPPSLRLYGPWLEAATVLATGPLTRAELRQRLGMNSRRFNQTLVLMHGAKVIAQVGGVISLTARGLMRWQGSAGRGEQA